ncbi:MAG: DUF6807 family protein [Planctomycetota bacterium]|jgi:hypothetical protein
MALTTPAVGGKPIRPGRVATTWLALWAAALLTGGFPAAGQDTLDVIPTDSTLTVNSGAEPLAVYQFSERPKKPYLQQLSTPGGVNVLRDAPADHLHHHGLMFAVAVDGVDFWSENEKCGRQKHVRLEQLRPYGRSNVAWLGFLQHIDWVGPEGQRVLLQERRAIDVCRMPDLGPTLLLWRCRLEVPPKTEPVKLGGSAYFGLGMRFVKSMDSGGRFRNADGKTGVEGTNDTPSTWCAYSAAVDGEPVTVAMFNDPANPRGPATWFTMESSFAYLAATLALHKEPLKIARDEPLVLKYGLAVWDGHVEPERIEHTYQRAIRLTHAAGAP